MFNLKKREFENDNYNEDKMVDKTETKISTKIKGGKKDTNIEKNQPNVSIIQKIYKLRHDFLIIGLTGRTGSGCSTVANILSSNFTSLKSKYKEFHSGDITNDVRKERIVYNYLKNVWKVPFTVITASDVIFYYALKLDFDDFVKSIYEANSYGKKINILDDYDNLKKEFESIKIEFETLHKKVVEIDKDLESKEDKYNKRKKIYKNLNCLIQKDIKDFRKNLRESLSNPTIIDLSLQAWGNNIRIYDSVVKSDREMSVLAPSCLAHKINQIIKVYKEYNKERSIPTLIVIDALRNPFEVIYFREKYSAFYLMSVNTTEEVRHRKLFEKGLRKEEVERIDRGEKYQKEENKSEIEKRYQYIDIDTCISLSDIFLTHDGTSFEHNEEIVTQVFTYLALIFHPGLVPPSPLERCMQVAYTAKLNSGCLSRQVGAAVTNKYYSIESIGWNTVAEGQTPCNLRSLYHLCDKEDVDAFSRFERNDSSFLKEIKRLAYEYKDWEKGAHEKLKGLTFNYCFKDVYTHVYREKELGNQVHTRSLHAEENAFLQLAKYGTTGIKGGYLFTTASCCELCAKKAYQLGIKKIYYIDAYPGISQSHIFDSGVNRPETILFHGAIGRAYVSLYNPLLPMKDEIHSLTGVVVKKKEDNEEQASLEKQSSNAQNN